MGRTAGSGQRLVSILVGLGLGDDLGRLKLQAKGLRAGDNVVRSGAVELGVLLRIPEAYDHSRAVGAVTGAIVTLEAGLLSEGNKDLSHKASMRAHTSSYRAGSKRTRAMRRYIVRPPPWRRHCTCGVTYPVAAW